MKKTISLLIFSLLIAAVSAQTATVPDPLMKTTYTEDVESTGAHVKTANGAIIAVSQDPDSGFRDIFTFDPFELFTSGDYKFIVNSSDRVGNDRVHSFDFLVEIPFLIMLNEPKFGYSSEIPYDIVAETTEIAYCSWSFIKDGDVDIGNLFDSDEIGQFTRIHTIYNATFDSSFVKQPVYFKCRDHTGNTTVQEFNFYVDTSPPDLDVEAIPNPVIDPAKRKSILNITTDEETVCTVNDAFVDGGDLDKESTYSINREQEIFFNVFTTNRTEFEQNITCYNKAGLNSSTSEIIVVELTSAFVIEVISPDDVVNAKSVDVIVSTPITTACFDENNKKLTTTDSLTHKKKMTKLSDGMHNTTIRCVSSSNSETAEIEFTVDTKPPTNVSITPDETKCSVEELSATFEADDSNGISHYNYSIRNKTGLIVGWTSITSSKVAHKKLDLVGGEQYIWQMTAYDKGGNKKDAEPVNVIPKDSNFEECDFFKPFIELTSSSASGGETFSVKCKTDSTLGCVNVYNYSIVAAGVTCSRPDSTNNIGQSQFVPYGSKICVWVQAKNGLTAFREKVVTAPPGSDGGDNGGAGDDSDDDSDSDDDFIPRQPGGDGSRGFCGNGAVETGEECDGSDLGSFSTCRDLGREGGALSCTPRCRYDTSDCSSDFDEGTIESGRGLFGSILMIIGLVLMLGGTGYLVYKSYYGPAPAPSQPKTKGPAPKPAVPQQTVRKTSVRSAPPPSLDKIREMERKKLLQEQERKMKKSQREKLFEEFEVQDGKKKK